MVLPDSARPPKLGLVLPPAAPSAPLWQAVNRANAGGIDSIWVTEHRTLAGTPWFDALTVLGALAGRVTRADIGTAVLVPGRRNPVYVAHALATASHLCAGRLVAGLGLGGLNPDEYAIDGADPRAGRSSHRRIRGASSAGCGRRKASPTNVGRRERDDRPAARA